MTEPEPLTYDAIKAAYPQAASYIWSCESRSRESTELAFKAARELGVSIDEVIDTYIGLSAVFEGIDDPKLEDMRRQIRSNDFRKYVAMKLGYV